MRSRRQATIRDLRTAIEVLPRHTRVAMLEGIRNNEIVVGAYTHDGGICPMLAAHRAGGRTDCIAFARAWDRFTLGPKRNATVRSARRATARELRVLTSHLEASLLDDLAPAAGPLGAVVAEHRALRESRMARERRVRADRPEPQRVRPGDAYRGRELGGRAGWAWTRVTRRLEDYERALEFVRDYGEAEAAPEREPALV